LAVAVALVLLLRLLPLAKVDRPCAVAAVAALVRVTLLRQQLYKVERVARLLPTW
jgi:hypothetical protein